MDEDVKKTVSSCWGCMLVAVPERPEPMIRRELPEEAWSDVAVDFLGPMPTGEHLFVIVDYYSRYLEIEIMHRITADELLKVWDRMFTRLGFPKSITMDNGRQFVSRKVDEYCRMKGITTNYTTPYWPQANGEVERQNRTILKRLKISHALHGNWKAELNNFLQMYYSTPHSTTGKTPSELMGRQIRTKLPGIEEIWRAPTNLGINETDKLLKQRGKEREDERRRAKESDLQVGDTVIQKNQMISDKLTTTYDPSRFKVVDKHGPNVTICSQDNDKTFERNVAHLRRVPETDATDDITCKDAVTDDIENNSEERHPMRSRQVRRKPAWAADYED